MSEVVVNEVRRDLYVDSVALMRHSRAIAALDGVLESALMMGTPSNKGLMADAGLLADQGEGAEGGDLVVAIRAESAKVAERALSLARSLLDAPERDDGADEAWHPRSIRSAMRRTTDWNLALISVPGWFAAAEARKAIRHGLHAMIFSDNVDLADEATLKQEAMKLGRLVMGPDCGTSIINGVPLAFANAVPRGHVGIVGASGTGIQEVSSLIARCGRGVSHAIGVGGRDMDERVGGISTVMALDALDDDADTRHVVIISKPPPPSVADKVLKRIAASHKDFTVCFLGAAEFSLPPNARPASTLKQAAESALEGDGLPPTFEPGDHLVPVARNASRVHGLFSGGSLCAEAQVVFRDAGEDVASNAPVAGVSGVTQADGGHVMLDLGDDQYTCGRPHPMIDPGVRDDAIVRALGDTDVALVLLDMVIGHGAHENPAAHLAALLAREKPADGPGLIASVTGTDADPQNLDRQVRILESSGVHVAPCNADAAALALASIRAGGGG